MKREYMTYAELRRKFIEYESKHPEKHLNGCVLISANSFTKEYPEESRTYKFSSNNKAFIPNMCGYSIYGTSVDESDIGVRLEQYLADECGGEVAYIEEGVLGYGTTLLYDLREPVHLKFVVIKEVYLNEWSSAHSIRQYNKIPQKYNKMLDEHWEKKEQEDIA